MALHPKNPNNQLSICLKPPFSGVGRQRPRSGLLQSGRQCRVSGRRCRIAQSGWPTVFSNALSVLPFVGCTPVLRYLQIGHSKVSFVLPAKRKKRHGSFRGAVRLLFERRKEGGERFAFGFLGAFLPFQLMEFLGILMPLTGEVCQCFTESFRILQPGFLPLTIAEQQVGSRKGLGQQGGLLFYNSFFPLLPTGSELLLTRISLQAASLSASSLWSWSNCCCKRVRWRV